MAPDFGAKIDGGEDSGGVYPDVVKDVGAKWSDKGKWMGFEVGDAGDVAEEVSVNKLLLRDPEFLTAIVDNGVLMGVPVGDKGTGRGGEEVWKDIG